MSRVTREQTCAEAGPRLGRPKDVDSAETRRRLLEAARRVFADRGYDVTTNRDIAAAAGITPGAIYHYFPSKAELYAGVFEQAQAYVDAELIASIDGHDTLVERFSSALDAAVDLDQRDPSYVRFLFSVPLVARRHPDVAEALGPVARVSDGFLRRIVDDAERAGELEPGVGARAVEDLLTVMLSGLANFSNVTADGTRHAAAIAVLKRVMAATAFRPGPTAGP